MPARYAVGIDLGTTHTVVAWSRAGGTEAPNVFEVPQFVSSSEVAPRPLFPSVLYAPWPGERLDDPFGDDPWVLGEFARRRAAEVPGRVVTSSKSWLAHPGVDRVAPILPWGADEGAPKLSPVEAATRLLAHVRGVWDRAHPDDPLAHQDVVLTVPASFDEVARELSVQAAAAAGLSPKLLEEPQAAFYDWISRPTSVGMAELLRDTRGEALVLIVDVGGGTTDLSLIRVAGVDRISRVAVGPHLLLGGDNMDLALAHACEPRLTDGSGKLDVARFAQLVLACRSAKEALLGSSPPSDAPVSLLGAGSSLVGSARTTRLDRVEVERIVLDGFFPMVDRDARPGAARSALVAFGLPYARDVAITRHIASFLARHLGRDEWPNAVLLNGGVFRSVRIADRLVDLLAGWRSESVARLPGADPDLAVARGAVAYARARSGHGVRIGGGTARSYFVGVVTEGATARAVCVVPRGADEGSIHVAHGRTFALAVGRPVRFDLFASDEVDARPGDVVDVEDDRFARLAPLTASLDARRPGDDVRVAVEGEVTAVGTVDLACVEVGSDAPERFRLAFQLGDKALESRSLSPSRATPSHRLQRALELVDRTFGKPRADASSREARDLLRELEKNLGGRSEWTTESNRVLCDALLARAGSRRRSVDHERVFWLLTGWCIRPGFGAPLDSARVAALWPRFGERLAFPQEARGWQQFWIAWRRAAGGLDDSMQTKIRDFVDPHWAPTERMKRPKKPALALDDALEMASSLERLPPARRSELGGWVLDRTWTDRDPRLWSALGRLGARVPAYGSVHHVVAPSVAERWIEHLLREKWDSVPTASSAAVQLARRTGDRARDIGDRVRREVEQRLVSTGATPEQLHAVRDVVPMAESDRAAFFGDALPLGLKLVG
ncbi:MAG: Hsp70 family protein [Polyangiaceae bacterium]|jgi:molecular chaperone DnaK (HSP70)